MRETDTLFSTARALTEHELYAFTSRTLADWLGINVFQTARLLKRMENAGLVAQVERGKYVLLGLTPERALSNPAFIASHLITPAYVSFWSALHFHGFTEQVPSTTFVAVTRRKAEVRFQSQTFHFVTLSPGQFFGYRRERLGDLPVILADEAKAIVDSLKWPRYAGGVEEVAKSLRNALSVLDVPTLVEYANRMGDRSLGSRLGYLLEIFGVAPVGLVIARGPVRLDPGRPRGGAYNNHWRVYSNLPQGAFNPAGAG